MFTGVMRWGPIAPLFGCNDAEFTFYLLRLLLGAAEAGFFPGIILYLTYWFPAERRSQVVAWFLSAVAVSNVAGSPLSGAIMQFMNGANSWRGWQWLFLLEGIPSIVVGLVVLAFLPDGPKQARWLSQTGQDLVIGRVHADEASKQALGQRHTLADAFGDLRVWALGIVYFVGAGCLYAVNFWMPTIVQELGVSHTDFLRVGLLSMIPWGVAGIAIVLWGINSDRTGERRWHCAGGLILTMIGLLLLAWVGHSPIASIVALTLVTSGTLGFVVTFWSLPTAFLSGTAAAAGIAWINSIGNLGGHVGPDVIGRIRTASGGASEAAFLALAAAALIGVLIILLLPRTQGKAITASAAANPSP
jgi:MFS family permease